MKILILFASFILTASFLAPPKEVKIQYFFKKGDVYECTQTNSKKVNQSFAGNEQNVETAINTTMILKVIELTATGARRKNNNHRFHQNN